MEIAFDFGFLRVLRFEIASLVDDRRFLFGLVLQILIISLLVPFLVNYADKVGSGGNVLSTRAKGFVPVGFQGDGHRDILAVLGGFNRVKVIEVESWTEALEGLEIGKYCVVLGSIENDGELNVVYNEGDPRSLSAMKIIELISDSYMETHRRNLLEKKLTRRMENSDIAESEVVEEIEKMMETCLEPIVLSISTLAGGEDGKEEGLGEHVDPSPTGNSGDERIAKGNFLSLIFISLGLCFPLLSGSGIMIESITGEKERRILEGLIGSPVSGQSILLGKFTTAFVVSTIQGIALLIILGVVMRIQNVILISLFLMAVSLAVISATSLVAVISMGSKEANLTITVLYVMLFVILFGPLMLPGTVAWISPFTPMVRLAAGESLDTLSAMAPLLGCIIFTEISLIVCFRLFERDDYIFGPRPSFRELLVDFVSPRTHNLKNRATLVGICAGLATVPAIVFPSILLFPSVAIIGTLGIIPGLACAALVEEYFKPYGIYLLKPLPGRREIILLGALAGLVFSLIENLLFTVALLGMSTLGGSLVYIRYLLAPMLHVGLSVLVVEGFRRGGNFRATTLALATVLHALYNIVGILMVIK